MEKINVSTLRENLAEYIKKAKNGQVITLEFINLVLTASQYVVKPISPEIAELSASLFPTVNKDPANKIIAATSIVEKADLVTADADLRHSGQVRTIW
jgi:PIN domain nuclease of toxin-antitoxin system